MSFHCDVFRCMAPIHLLLLQPVDDICLKCYKKVTIDITFIFFKGFLIYANFNMVIIGDRLFETFPRVNHFESPL